MASKKSKPTNSEANGVAAVNVVSGTEAEASANGTKLRWTSLKPVAGTAQRTRKAKTKKTAKPKDDTATTGKLSALDAAAKVLQEAGKPMNCQEMIQTMAAKGYWTSPAGKTPASTLYSSILRELKAKAKQARFQKTARGQFVYQAPQAS
jgi:hypothetical protein